MSDIARRLGRLQLIYGAKGCDTCRGWDTTRVEIVPANVEPLPLDRPDRCPDCGRRAPQTTAVVHIVMPDDGEGAA